MQNVGFKTFKRRDQLGDLDVGYVESTVYCTNGT
jgi:hypothetical protein